jgi:hypothetical protein
MSSLLDSKYITREWRSQFCRGGPLWPPNIGQGRHKGLCPYGLAVYLWRPVLRDFSRNNLPIFLENPPYPPLQKGGIKTYLYKLSPLRKAISLS